MNCIIKIYLDNKIANCIPIPLQMSEEEEERLKTKQKEHIKQELQEKGDEFTDADKRRVGLLMEELIDHYVPKMKVPLPAPPRKQELPEGNPTSPLDTELPGKLPAGTPTPPLGSELPGKLPAGTPTPLGTGLPGKLPAGTPTPSVDVPDLNADPESPMFEKPGEGDLTRDEIFARMAEGLGNITNYVKKSSPVPSPPVIDLQANDDSFSVRTVHGGLAPIPLNDSLQFFNKMDGKNMGRDGEINEAKPLHSTMALQNPLEGFLQFPDLDKMDWKNNYDGELYKVANYIYNVISNEKNLETRTFMISTIYHNYLSELITTL